MSPELHGRVRSLFDQALELPEADRLSFLQSACSGDPEGLKAVSRLLEAHRGSESFLDGDTRPTRRIGRFIPTGELGRGAMGIVYEAIDPLIGRKVAVKVIHLQAFADPGKAQFLRERLFREARSAGALSHPGIVTIFDVGQQGDLAFIAMERVEGQSLYQLLASGRRLARAQVFDILRQAAAALDYAHRHGVVHRDIKPANIMLDHGIAVKIADFGIAKVTTSERQTLTAMVMGTPSYMSPEQIESLPSDGCSDQFSLAVVAYELLTGRLPFDANSMTALAHMIVYAGRPSARAANAELPPAVDLVFYRGLAKLPADRYPNCAAFVRALEEASNSAVIPEPAIEIPARNPLSEPAAMAPVAVRAARSNSARNLLYGGIALLALLAGVLLYEVLPLSRGAPGDGPAVVAAPGPVAAPPAPVVSQFIADPPSIKSGATATLHWDVKGATEVAIDQGIGKVGAADKLDIAPLKDATYVLTATGPGGKVSAPASVKVTADPNPAIAKTRTQLCDDAEAQFSAHHVKRAVDLFLQAANLGEPRCMVDLGEAYMDDNATQAVGWFRKAADAGNSSGMVHLGGMYELGSGVLEDPRLAAFWYRKAADAGNADAMFNLGRMHEDGLGGFPKDSKLAKELYLKAAALGNGEAKARLAKLEK